MNKAILRVCGIICVICGIVICYLTFSQNNSNIFNKLNGFLQLIVGSIFLVLSFYTKKRDS